MGIENGTRFTRLLVVNKVSGKRSLYHCVCDCGKELDVYGCRLKSGHTKSCGCLNDDVRKFSIGKRSLKHGMTNTILYSKYCSMKGRCFNPNYQYYSRYGGRGISICHEWLDSFESFAKWAYENGFDDSKTGYEQTLDRIDNNKDYCPENCRWIDQKEQVKNRSITTHIIYNGEDLNYTEFSRKYGIGNDTFVRRRFEKGQSPEQIIHDWNTLHSNDYYSIKEASVHYNVSNETIYNWIYRGILTAEKYGNKWIIPKGQTICI